MLLVGGGTRRDPRIPRPARRRARRTMETTTKMEEGIFSVPLREGDRGEGGIVLALERRAVTVPRFMRGS